MSNTTTCKCGATIHWAVNPESGKRVPIDIKPKVYRLIQMNDGSYECIPEVVDGGDQLGVNHFFTCPKANEFGGKRRDA